MFNYKFYVEIICISIFVNVVNRGMINYKYYDIYYIELILGIKFKIL